jgi:hypothetical protein
MPYLPNPVNGLNALELSELLDLLIEHTAHHTDLISRGGTREEFRINREILRELQSEIEFRQTAYISPRNISHYSDQQD